VAPRVDAMIVVGAPNSSNSQRLREVAERAGCPLGAGAARRRHRLDALSTASAARRHRRRLGAGGAGRGDHRRLRERFDVKSRGHGGRREASFFNLPRELRDAGGGVAAVGVAVYTDVSDEELAAFLAATTSARLLSYKGIAEGVENSNYLLHTTSRALLHPDALREARRRRRPALLPRPDGASRRRAASTARCRCANRDGERSAARRPAGGDRHLPRRHVDAPAE
jgi:hypothetical protein